MGSNLFSVAMKATAKLQIAQSRKMLPPAEYETCDIKDCKITMPDGIHLAASISSPDFGKKWPVVVMRYPYIAYDWMRDFYHKLFAEHGYAFALIQVRGTVHSEGEFLAMQEDKDGRAVLDWVAEQTWCDGNIATIGASYCGNTQWAIADYHHPFLKTMYISVFGAEGYNTFYHRGLFNLEVWAEWSAQMMGDNKYDMLMGKAAEKLRNRAFAARPQTRIGEQMIGTPCTWYKDWVSNPTGDEEYWNSGYWKKLEEMPEKLNIPVFLHAGYFDIFYHAMMSSYRRIPQEIKDQSVLMIGPWAHSGLSGGDLKYPGQEKAGFLQAVSAIKWFDHIIKGKEYTDPIGCIEAYNIGENKWETWENGFTHDREMSVYLDSLTWRDGAFIAPLETPRRNAVLHYIYDPQNPVPSRGGRLIANHNSSSGSAECSCLQEPPGKRSDVISFVTDPFEHQGKITGSIRANLFVASDAPATAFTIRLFEVLPDGKTYNIQDDFTDIRWRTPNEKSDYTPGEVRELVFEMVEISWTMKPGSRLRIDISSSDYPHFAPHKNTTEPWAETVLSKPAKQTLLTGPDYPSRVILPITEE